MVLHSLLPGGWWVCRSSPPIPSHGSNTLSAFAHDPSSVLHPGSMQGLWYINWFRFILLFSSIIPVSLRVNLDMGKAVYSYKIKNDPTLPGVGVNNSNLPEVLSCPMAGNQQSRHRGLCICMQPFNLPAHPPLRVLLRTLLQRSTMHRSVQHFVLAWSSILLNAHLASKCEQAILNLFGLLNPDVLRNPNFCVGCFEFYLHNIFATAPKIGENYFIFSIFFTRFSFAELVLVE